ARRRGVALTALAGLLGLGIGLGIAPSAVPVRSPRSTTVPSADDVPALSVLPSIVYGLAEPAGSLPGTGSPGDGAEWDRIRTDVVGSGGCWLRSDLNEWLSGAIDAYAWLGTAGPCSASMSSPIKVLAILDDQTVWSARRLCPGAAFSSTYRARRPDFSLDDWRLLVGCIARRYAGRISAYEIWNEPLLPNSMLGFEDGSAAHYRDLLRVADEEISAADPAATVVALGGSDAWAGGDPERMDAMRDFTSQLVALGAPAWADAISLHAYPWGAGNAAAWSSYRAEVAFQAAAWHRPVWITETGQRASDGDQVAYARTAYPILAAAGARAIFWFSDTDQPDGDFGVRDQPVESTLRSLTLGR
ncbi:MAG TPA: hypothetical protein VFW86_01565, partial [Candidatus Limnocylindrales bacterium]|nr:hypothetical protein [Candidatus Limnocylindrales bacterium]